MSNSELAKQTFWTNFKNKITVDERIYEHNPLWRRDR